MNEFFSPATKERRLMSSAKGFLPFLYNNMLTRGLYATNIRIPMDLSCAIDPSCACRILYRPYCVHSTIRNCWILQSTTSYESLRAKCCCRCCVSVLMINPRKRYTSCEVQTTQRGFCPLFHRNTHRPQLVSSFGHRGHVVIMFDEILAMHI